MEPLTVSTSNVRRTEVVIRPSPTSVASDSGLTFSTAHTAKPHLQPHRRQNVEVETSTPRPQLVRKCSVHTSCAHAAAPFTVRFKAISCTLSYLHRKLWWPLVYFTKVIMIITISPSSNSFFGDFDLSILQQFPQGKRRVVTELVEDASRGIIDTAIEQTVKAGKQGFVVCPLIALSTKRTRRSVISEAERLQHQFPHIRWGLLHGKMEGPDQQHILNSLLNHSLDGIIATTVVEVGIDIPDAALLVVEGAESFGLAQLHQLRGRIGRAGQTARCLLVPSEGAEAHERLEALVQTDDGWKLAEIDLRLRGPGQLIGMDQSGQSVITLAQLGNRALLEQAHDAARELIMKDPALEKYPLVKEKILMSRLVRG